MSEVTDLHIDYTVKLNAEDLYLAFCEYYWFAKYWAQLTLISTILSLTVFLPHQAFSIPATCFALLTVLILLNRFVIFKSYAERTLQTPMFQSEQHYVVGMDGIKVDSPNFNSNVQWNQFIKWSEGTNSFLINPSPYAFYVVPKRCLSSLEQEELRKTLQVKVIAKDSPSQRKKIRAAIAGFLLMMLVSFIGGLVSAMHKHSHDDSNRQVEDEP